MKLFRETGKEDVFEFETEDMLTGERTTEREVKIELELVPETVDYILNTDGGSTLERIRQLILHLYNHRHYKGLDLFGLMRGADDEHAELAVNIIESCALKYGDSCFLMIDEFAPKMIDHFGYADNVA